MRQIKTPTKAKTRIIETMIAIRTDNIWRDISEW